MTSRERMQSESRRAEHYTKENDLWPVTCDLWPVFVPAGDSGHNKTKQNKIMLTKETFFYDGDVSF